MLEFDDVERRLKPFRRRYLGVRAIPLEALVGTDGRANAFTRDFRPLHAFSRDRLRSLRRAFGDGGYPPIVAVKLGDAYFVLDGHRRAALARPGVRIPVGRPAQYLELLENIQVHGYHLMRGRGRVRTARRS